MSCPSSPRREDVGGALDAGEQVGAVVGLQERVERFDALDDQRQVVLAAEREHRIDQVVPLALLAQEDFEAVGEEGEEVDICTIAICNIVLVRAHLPGR